MPNNEIFSGIPSLDDTQGLENLLNNQALQGMGLNTQTPSALDTNQDDGSQITEPAQPQVQQPAQQPAQYTSEQIAQIIARNQQLEAQQQQNQQRQLQQAGYNQQQIGIINQLMARGYTLDQIQTAINNRKQANAVNNAMSQRLQSIEQHLQQQQYQAAEAEFVQKMTTFGDKFGLSEQDLVTFANYAYDQGINVADVKDLEPIFRAFYPDQYALRVQRMNANSTSQIYGGVNAPEAPRASVSKLEDAYVDKFLQGAMPNQYNMFNKK